MNDEIKQPLAKGASAAVMFFGTMTWGEIAQMLAAFYTACLVTEWLWKRVAKPALQRLGWIQGKRRDFLDSTGSAPLGDK